MNHSKAISIVFACVAVLVTASETASQRKIPLKKSQPAVKQLRTVSKQELSFEQKVQDAFKTPQNWQYFQAPEFSVKAILPRAPIRQAEPFYDDALGKVEMVMYASPGDSAIYILGRLKLPYSVTDDTVMAEFYSEMAKEMAGDKDFVLGETKNFHFEGKPGIEFVSKVSDPRFEPSRMRYVLKGREVYMLLSMPYASVPGDDPLTREGRSDLRADMDSFFASRASNEERPMKAAKSIGNESDPVFESSFSESVFSNKALGFSLVIPNGWKLLPREDVEGLRQWGRDLITNNSDLKIPAPEKRQTLAMFTSGPLGGVDISTLNIVVGGPVSDFSEVVKFARFTENMLLGIKNYEVTVKPVETSFANERMMRLETKVRVGDQVQGQVILIWSRKGRLVAFSLSHMREDDRNLLPTILDSLKLAAQAPTSAP